MALAALSVFFAAVDEGEVVSASLRKTAETKKKLRRAKIKERLKSNDLRFCYATEKEQNDV